MQLKKPKLLFGNIDFQAQGNSKNVEFKLKSEGLKRNLDLGGIKNFISLNLSGHYTPELLTLRDNFILNYEKENLPITIDAKIGLKPPYKANGSLVSKKDKIVVNSFSYENKQVKSDSLVDIKDLYIYRAMMKNPLYGPLKINAKYTDALNITTNSLGGELKVEMNQNKVHLKLKEIDVVRIAHLIGKDYIFSSGNLNGYGLYNRNDKTAKSDINMKSLVLNGVDINKKVSNFNDLIGLNVINMSKSIISSLSPSNKEQTNIEHMQFNISLKDKNIKLDDVAMSTDAFLFVALGNLKQDGEINSLKLSIVDAKGCAIITQGLKGNIKNPKTTQSTSTLINAVGSVPSALFDTSKQVLNFATGTIDGITSYGVQKILRTDKNVSITSDLVTESLSLIKNTSNIVMPTGCKIIYNGRVKHPLKTKDK